MLPRPSLVGSIFALALTGAIALACGGSGDSEFDENAQNANGPDGGGAGNGDNTSFGGGNGSGDGTGNGNGSGNGSGAACVAQPAVAERAPAYLYFIFDRSGSMGKTGDGDPTKKLNPVKSAFGAFTQAPSSKGISATLTLFPDTGVSASTSCTSARYRTPAVALSALPDSAQAFIDALPKDPETDLGGVNHGTPTLAAVQGVLPQAKANSDAHKGKDSSKTAVVILTDGDPYQCGSGNTASAVATELAKYRPDVLTYVIGVGGSTANLDAIAVGGGTGPKAMIVSVGDPAQTEKDLTAQIDKIRLSSLSCDVAIPAPPAGETLDLNKVNVSFTPKGGTKTPLAYDQECKANGWKFDDAAKPTKISLCTCGDAQKDPGSAIVVEFGCARRESGIK